MCRTYGYARVSTREQNLDRQLVALERFGVEPSMVFADKESGRDFERAQYQRLRSLLSAGDVLVVKSIDRLGRDYGEIIEEWRAITKGAGADVVVIDMPLLDTRTSAGAAGVTGELISDIVLELLSYVAQIERENTLQRQAEGIEAARGRGVRFGRPPKQRPENYEQVRDSYLSGALGQLESATRLGVSPRTFMRWVKADGAA